MTVKFEDKGLGVSAGTMGILIVYSRIYADRRPDSLIVRDGIDTFCVVKEVPVKLINDSLIGLAVRTYEGMTKNGSIIAKMNATV